MARDVFEVDSVAAARALAAGRGGRFLVLDSETLRQIEEAEAQGAFEGGMSGNAGGAPYSADGRGGDNRSDGNDPPPTFDASDFEGVAMISIEDAIEKVLDLKDLIEALSGAALGPMILVPKRELQRWLNGGAPDGA